MLLLLFACGSEPEPVDMDGDGSPQGVDCTDVDPRRTPGADEHCDGVDEDCDGVADEDAVDATPWYADADGDGYGADSNFIVSCVALVGRVQAGGDCEDDNPDVAPDQVEHCDGVDEDCDGTVDNGAVDGVLIYEDADGDGYGAGDGAAGCPGDGAEAPGDCDETDAAISPAATESCDGIDTNCDGSPDLGAVDGLPWWTDADGDGYGDPDSDPVLDCEGSEGAPNRFDCDDTDAAVRPPDACGLGLATPSGEADVVITGTAAGQVVGSSLAMDDVDGDGVLDLIVGAPGPTEGSVYIYSHLRGAETLDGALARRDGDVSEALGSAVGAADLDGDGAIDLYAGAPMDANTSTRAGAVWVFPGPLSGRADVNDGYGIYGETVSDLAGTDVAWVGDTTGDGIGDLAIGAPYAANQDGSGKSHQGGCYILAGPISATFDMSLQTEWAWIYGTSSNDELGRAVSGGDLDGDGISEVLLGVADGYQAFVVPGGVTGLVDEEDVPEIGGRGGTIVVGTSMEYHPDINGDGYGDVLSGAPALENGFAFAGEVYVISGPVTADVDLPDDAWLVLTGEERGDETGLAVQAGDVDGDGAIEVVVSAPETDHGGVEAGSIYVYGGLRAGTFALADADARIDGHASDLFLGASLAVGDLDGDGADEIAVGTTHDDVGGASAGAVYVFWGGE